MTEVGVQAAKWFKDDDMIDVLDEHIHMQKSVDIVNEVRFSDTCTCWRIVSRDTHSHKQNQLLLVLIVQISCRLYAFNWSGELCDQAVLLFYRSQPVAGLFTGILPHSLSQTMTPIYLFIPTAH